MKRYFGVIAACFVLNSCNSNNYTNPDNLYKDNDSLPNITSSGYSFNGQKSYKDFYNQRKSIESWYSGAGGTISPSLAADIDQVFNELKGRNPIFSAKNLSIIEFTQLRDNPWVVDYSMPLMGYITIGYTNPYNRQNFDWVAQVKLNLSNQSVLDVEYNNSFDGIGSDVTTNTMMRGRYEYAHNAVKTPMIRFDLQGVDGIPNDVPQFGFVNPDSNNLATVVTVNGDVYQIDNGQGDTSTMSIEKYSKKNIKVKKVGKV